MWCPNQRYLRIGSDGGASTPSDMHNENPSWGVMPASLVSRSGTQMTKPEVGFGIWGTKTHRCFSPSDWLMTSLLTNPRTRVPGPGQLRNTTRWNFDCFGSPTASTIFRAAE